MSFKQCSGCKKMVAESKAFCPDCDTPMDDEQKRSGSYELDSQMKTQNLSSTSQHILMEQLNLSTFFNFPASTSNESKTFEPNTKPIQPKAIEAQPKFIQQTQVNNLREIPDIKPQPEAIFYPEPPTNTAVNNPEPAEISTNSRKIFYIVGGISIVFLFFVIAIVAAIFCVFYFNLWK